jgi:hypothetical protein
MILMNINRWERMNNAHITGNGPLKKYLSQKKLLIVLFVILSAVFICYPLSTDGDIPEHKSSNQSMTEQRFSGFDWLWSYNDEIIGITPDAVLGSKQEFNLWRNSFAKTFYAYFDSVFIPDPEKIEQRRIETNKNYHLTEITFSFPDDFISGGTIGALLAIPNTIDKNKPVIIAISGHEISPWGKPPLKLFSDSLWGEKFVEAGYVVFAPAHVFYDELSHFWPAHDYHVVWTKIEEKLLRAITPYLPQHKGLAVVGLSSGATTSAILMARNTDIHVGVFAGILRPLDYLRENYRIKGHPNQWDMRMLYSYVPMYSLIAPRPVQWQIGEKDSWFPRTSPHPPRGSYFPGTPRGVSTTEMAGEFLVMQKIWSKFDSDVELYIHAGGHMVSFEAAEEFVKRHCK